MRFFLPLFAAFALCGNVQSATALTATSTEECLADLSAIDSMLGRISAGTPGGDGANSLSSLLPADKQPVFDDGFCVIRDIRFPMVRAPSLVTEYRVSALRWQADWAGPTRPMPPNMLVIELRDSGTGFASSSDMTDVLDYQSRLLRDIYPNDFRLELAFDPQADRLEIRQLAAQNGYSNRFMFSATLNNADLDGVLNTEWSNAPPLDKLGMITIDDANLTATNHGFFEIVAPTWVHVVYPRLGPTPEEAVGAAQDIAKGLIGQIPEKLTSASDQAELVAMIDAIPHPLGTLDLQLDTANGIAPSRFVATMLMVKTPSWDSFAGLLDGATIKVDWTPAEWPPAPFPPLITQ